MYELCRHLLASGRRCTQPAVHEARYCRHHGVVKRTIADSILPPGTASVRHPANAGGPAVREGMAAILGAPSRAPTGACS